MNVTVCIPSYNSAATLPETLESALGQAFGDYELLVSDNASTDGTQDCIAAFPDRRIFYHRHTENLGYARNVRWCIEHASGEIVAILCSDDVWKPDLLRTLVGAIRDGDDVVLSYSAYEILRHDRHGQRWLTPPRIAARPELCDGPTYVRDEFRAPYTILSAAAFRRRAALTGSFQQSHQKFVPDMIHRMRVGVQGRVRYIKSPLALYREHAGSLTSRNQACDWIDEERAVIEELARDPALQAANLGPLVRERLRFLFRQYLNSLPWRRAAGARRRELLKIWWHIARLAPAAAMAPRNLAQTAGALSLPPAAAAWLLRAYEHPVRYASPSLRSEPSPSGGAE